MPVLTIYDETTAGEKSRAMDLDIATDVISVGELIEKRVRNEVQAYNAEKTKAFQGLVRPTEAEQALNGYLMKRSRKIDPEKQLEAALEAFRSNQVLILIDEQQAESLDQIFQLGNETQVSFLKLVPLVGG